MKSKLVRVPVELRKTYRPDVGLALIDAEA